MKKIKFILLISAIGFGLSQCRSLPTVQDWV
jgi:hypothetical protein